MGRSGYDRTATQEFILPSGKGKEQEMLRCKKCGYRNPRYEMYCPECSAKYEFTDSECCELFRDAEEYYAKNDFIRAIEIYKILASAGYAPAERELAIALERGQLLPRDYEAAINYYASSAAKGDPYAAYKHAHTLVGNDAKRDFWLAYATVMGCKDAYTEAVALFSRYKERGTAAYFCSQLAEEGDTDAIIEMARRHLYGDGVEQSERQAKWYMERVDRVPLHGMKLHRRIQAVEAKSVRPEFPRFTERNKIIERLISAAKKYRLHKVLLSLCNLYSEGGTKDATVFLAMLHIEGIEFRQNVDLGISMLENALHDGSVIAAKLLGDIYASGEQVEKSNETATTYYLKAAALGGWGQEEALGDVFLLGDITEPNYALALSLYEQGAEGGSFGCQRKLEILHEERERCYIEASRLERSSPDEAFLLFKKSVELGYLPSHARIGWYYERGLGVKCDRKAAFNHYKAAYEAGDKRAIESLGRCYARGIGTAFNFERASELLSVAREMGSQSADKELYRIYENKKRHMIRSLYSTATRLYYQKKYDTARSMMEVCMQLGLGEATYSIGCMHEFGITVAPNRKAALNFYKKAADQGYTDPRQYHKQSMLRIWKQA